MAPALDIDFHQATISDDGTTNTVNGLSKQSAEYVALWQDKVRGGFAPFPVSVLISLPSVRDRETEDIRS